jgi:hypothetical protein
VDLVDDEESHRPLDRRQVLAPEHVVREALRRDEQDIDRVSSRAASTEVHSSRLFEFTVSARSPMASAARIWSRMSESRGLMISVGPWPWSRQQRVAIQ